MSDCPRTDAIWNARSYLLLFPPDAEGEHQNANAAIAAALLDSERELAEAKVLNANLANAYVVEREVLLSARAELDASDVKDAARYRFWREYYHSNFALKVPGPTLVFVPIRPMVEIAGPEYKTLVDAAIDAARKAAP